MTRLKWAAALPCLALLGAAAAHTIGAAAATDNDALAPDGKRVTPTAARGAVLQALNPGIPSVPQLRVGQAAAIALSPDGRTLAIQTSGYNQYYDRHAQVVPELWNEYVFLFDVTGARPRQRQVLEIAHTFPGLAWGGRSDRMSMRFAGPCSSPARSSSRGLS